MSPRLTWPLPRTERTMTDLIACTCPSRRRVDPDCPLHGTDHDDTPFFAGGMSHREDRIASQNDD